LQRELGAEGVIHVPVGGSAAMRWAVLGGHVDLTTLSYSEALQWVQQGEVTAIAVLATERLPGLPGVPSVVELGIPNVQVYTTRGLVAPPGLPEERRAIRGWGWGEPACRCTRRGASWDRPVSPKSDGPFSSGVSGKPSPDPSSSAGRKARARISSPAGVASTWSRHGSWQKTSRLSVRPLGKQTRHCGQPSVDPGRGSIGPLPGPRLAASGW